jgi:hypothetical protein
MLSVMMLVILNVVMPCVVTLNVVMLNAVMVSVVAPTATGLKIEIEYFSWKKKTFFETSFWG